MNLLGRASPSIRDPFRSPKLDEAGLRKPLGTFWITPPIKRSGSESHLRRGCLEKCLRRRQIFSEGDNVAAGHIQLEPGAEKLNKSSEDNSCVCSSLRMTFGRSADRGGSDIPRCSGCHSHQGPHRKFHGPLRSMFLDPLW